MNRYYLAACPDRAQKLRYKGYCFKHFRGKIYILGETPGKEDLYSLCSSIDQVIEQHSFDPRFDMSCFYAVVKTYEMPHGLSLMNPEELRAKSQWTGESIERIIALDVKEEYQFRIWENNE